LKPSQNTFAHFAPLRLGVVLTLVLLFAAGVFSAWAQGVESTPPIAYDQVVTDDLTNEQFFDWWKLDAAAGDIIVVDMQAASGLAPLIGILAPGGDLVARSDDGPVDSKVQVEYTAETDGPFLVVATRVGNENGTTTGTYTLVVRRANPNAATDNDLQEVEFRCNDVIATTAATLEFADDAADLAYYRISIYGLDGFQPVIRVHYSAQDYTACFKDAQAMAGDLYTLPDADPLTLTEDRLDTAAQLTVRSAHLVGDVTLTIGDVNGVPGRYLAVIEGFSIARPGDTDILQARLGPLARDTALLVYMVGAEASRLDPFIRIDTDDPAAAEISCDDTGRRGCDDVPSIIGAGVRFNDDVNVIGDRFDAGLRLAPGNPDPLYLELSSRENDTYGGYSLVIVGEMPTRE
jgi:hypothetical protein